MNRSEAERVIDAIGAEIERHERFLVAGHKRPDGDCLGSQLGLARLLEAKGKSVHLFSEGPIPDVYDFLDGVGGFRDAMPPEGWADATFLLDCSTPDRVGEGFEARGATLCVDHHATAETFARINYVDPKASSTGEIVLALFERLGVEVSPEAATCLYAAVLTDTGGFRFSNTRPPCLRAAARLVELGADPEAVYAACYERQSAASVRLEGEVLATARFERDGRLVWSQITAEMYDRAGGEQAEPENVVARLRGVRGVTIALLFKEKGDICQVSFRSRGEADVSRMAKGFGGGGHNKAAGAEIRGDFEDVKRRVLDAARTYLEESAPSL